MYYITPRNSETGKKLQAIMDKGKMCVKAQEKLAKKYGFKEWYTCSLHIYGGISAAVFATPPDSKIWSKREKDGYFPKLSTKVGKAMAAEFEALPVVFPYELNMAIGWQQKWKHVGYESNKTHFGIVVKEEWGLKMPDDCTEITTIDYRKQFKEKKSKKQS